MAKKTVSKSSISRTNKNSKTRIQSSGRRALLLTILLFGVIGTVLIVRSLAAPNGPDPSKDIVAAYINSKPTTVEQDAQGTLNYPSVTASYMVLADGTLICDDGNPSGDVQTATIGNGVVKQLTGDIGSLQLADVPQQSAPAGQTVYIDNFEGYLFRNGSDVKGYAVYPGAQKADKLAKLQNMLLRVCAANAHKSEKRSDVQYNVPFTANASTAAASTQSKLARSVQSLAFGTASAVTPPAPSIYEDTTAEARTLTLLNSYRYSRGLRQLSRPYCLDTVAKNWATYLANNNIMVHQDPYQLLSKVSSYCSISVSKIVGVGENLGEEGTAATADDVFNAWLASSGHLANIQDRSWKYVGIGVYVNSSTGMRYYTTDFSGW